MYLPSKEEQRYGRNKETVINHSYIESGEYRKKFDRISNSAELNKLLYQLAKKMLHHRSGTLYEDMYWIDPFNSNFQNKNGMGVVCCHDGKVFRYWAKELLQEQKCDFFQRKYYNMYKDEERAQMEMWKIITQQENVYLEEV